MITITEKINKAWYFSEGQNNHCKIRETLFIQEFEPAFNVNVGGESGRFIYLFCYYYS